MIVGVITIFTLFLGGGLFSFDYIGDVAEAIIKDEDRAKQVVGITELADEAYELFADNLDTLSKQLVQMNQDYNLTREEIDAFSNPAKKNRTAFLEKYVDLRFQVKDLVPAEEWQAMHGE